MEEEKNKKDTSQSSQPKDNVKKHADKAKKTFKKAKKFIEFLKRHPLLAKILFWVCLVIIIIIIFISILHVIGLASDEGATDALGNLKYGLTNLYDSSGDSSSSSGNDATYVETGASIEGNEYILKYGTYGEDEKKRRVQEMKNLLKKRNIEIYSNQCLLFLYELQENGLDIGLYNKQDLEALYMFYKAEIATSSIDLRSADQMYEQDENGKYVYKYPENSVVPVYTENGETKFGYSKESYNENDYSDDTVYGTIRIERITYKADANNKTEGTVNNLSYISYEKFKELLERGKDPNKGDGQDEILNYFTIDSQYNLIVAGWSNSETTYTFSGLEEYTKEEQEEIKKDFPENGMEEDYNIYKCKSIPYQEYISKYSLNFDFLMALLATTNNGDFCKEIAKISEKSYMVITLHEEYSELKETITYNYTNHEKIYATLDAKIAAEGQGFKLESGNIDVNNSSVLKLKSLYHWNEDTGTTDTQTKYENHRVIMETKYSWTYKESDTVSWDYVITEKLDQQQNKTITMTYKKKTALASSGEKLVPNLFITKTHNLVKVGYPPAEIRYLPPLVAEEENGETLNNDILDGLTGYTKNTTKEYTLTQVTTKKVNSYEIEVTEVSNWYEYYKKEYTKFQTMDIGVGFSENIRKLPIDSGKKEIEESKINQLDYIKAISEDTKKNFIKSELNQTDITNYEFRIEKLEEHFFKYGEVHQEKDSQGYEYTKGIFVTENVQVKVQNKNTKAILVIVADALANKNTEVNTNVEYSTIDTMENSFLYVYDKDEYKSVRSTVFSIDEWIFKMLDNSPNAIHMTNLLKYLLFLYDGTDLGVTDYNLNLFRPEAFITASKIKGSTLADKIWYTLRSLGYSKASVAGVLGNLHYESAGLNPDIVEYGTGIGIGLAQWSYDRRTALETYAMSKGEHWSDEDTQIEFLVDEIDGKGEFTNGIAKDAFLDVTYGGRLYTKEVWMNVDETTDWRIAVKDATTAFCIAWERPKSPQDNLGDRIKYAEDYYIYYKDKEFGGEYTTQDCFGHVRAKFKSVSGKTFLILQQTSTFLPDKCNRASCISIASAYAPDKTADELVNDLNSCYDGKYHGAIPSNENYWNKYGLEITNPSVVYNTVDYIDVLEEQLNKGGYALIWLNNNEMPYDGKTVPQWSSKYHWIAILGIKYEGENCYIAASTSGNGVNDWIPIDEFTTHGVTHMVFVNEKK